MTVTAHPFLASASAMPVPAPALGAPAGYMIEPGTGRAEAIAVLPADQAVDELTAVVRDLRRRGWVVDLRCYSRLVGSHHRVGLTRLV